MRIAVFIVVLLILLQSACSRYNAPALEPANSGETQIVINIIGDAASPFKDTIIDSLKLAYDGRAQVRQRQIKRAEELDTNADVNIVMDQLKAWLWMNGTFKKLMKSADPSKTIFVMTAGDDKWTYKGQEGVVITAASRKEKPDRALQEIMARIDKALIASE